jgi:hypothetical protein
MTMNKKRLLKLADLLEADAKNKKGVRFDLTAWAQKQDADEPTYFNAYAFSPGEKISVNCGTAACAWGLAAISGVFKRQGVEYKIYNSGFLVPTFDGKDEIDAATAFFDINTDQAWFLFDPGEYPQSYAYAIKTRYGLDLLSISYSRSELIGQANKPAGQSVVPIRISEIAGHPRAAVSRPNQGLEK